MNNSQITQNEIKIAESLGRQISTKHVFFAGKLFRDDNGSDTFVNMFTIILE